MQIESVNAYDNISRTLTSLEKSLDRLARTNYHDRSQYPDIFFAIEHTTVANKWHSAISK